MTPQQPQELDKALDEVLTGTYSPEGLKASLKALITQHDTALLESIKESGPGDLTLPDKQQWPKRRLMFLAKNRQNSRWRVFIDAKIQSLKPERYLCQSYYDNNNVLQDCTCGKCE